MPTNEQFKGALQELADSFSDLDPEAFEEICAEHGLLMIDPEDGSELVWAWTIGEDE